MNENIKEKLSFLKVLFIALFFGALWGILEATLGTILHLPAFNQFGLYTKSSVIIIPIAYILMAACYKKTNELYSVMIMGLVASIMKLSVGFIIGFIDVVYFPAIYILVEASAMLGALAIFKPTNVVSLKTLGSIIMANTLYQFSYLLISSFTGSTNAFSSLENWKQVGEKYLFLYNGVAILYVFFGGLIAFGFIKLFERLNIEFKFDINKILCSPITASIMVIVGFALTIGLSAL